MASGPICHVIESEIACNDISQRRLSAAARFLNTPDSFKSGRLLFSREMKALFTERLRGGTRKVLHQRCRRLNESLLTSETITSHKHLTSCSRRKTLEDLWLRCSRVTQIFPTMRQHPTHDNSIAWSNLILPQLIDAFSAIEAIGVRANYGCQL